MSKLNDTPLEREECYVFADWCRNKGFMFNHLAQESYSWGIRSINKKMGVSGGVPDYMIILPQGLVFIEMKRKKGSNISEAQKQWLEALQKIPNVEAKVCYGADEAIAFVEEILKQQPHD